MIYCAGKEYRKLGVANEERFMGKGVGFCANCDAPLYQDKRVAVVGGGNSAFTSARDLIRFAKEVHLVHRKTGFTADELLVKQVLGSDKVTVHAPMTVDSFLGKDRLTGVRLSSTEGQGRDRPVGRWGVPGDRAQPELGTDPGTGGNERDRRGGRRRRTNPPPPLACSWPGM